MIVLHVAMSVDGYIAGPDHDMSWTGGAEYDTANDLADEVARRTGAIVAGRGWYDVASRDKEGALAGIYGGAWSGPVVVVTHRPDDLASTPGIETVQDVRAGITRAEELAGNRDVGVFGGDVARQALELGRLDEIVVQIVPIVLGAGVPLLGVRPGPQVNLERVHLGASGPLTDIRFRIAKQTR